MNGQLSAEDTKVFARKYGKLISWILIVSLLCKLFDWIIGFYAGGNIWSGYSITDYLINWQSGFVRRGLYGEMLYRYSLLTDLSPLTILIPIIICAYIGVAVWLLKLCRARGVKWWIVFSSVLCGFVYYLERKDFLLYILVFLSFSIINSVKPSLRRNIGISFILILGLFIHEAFFFWGVPVMLFLLSGERRLKRLNIAIGIGLTVLFLILCMYKGDASNAIGIYNSWNDLLPLPADWKDCGALEALSWDIYDTALYHFRSNFYSVSFQWMTVILRLATFVVFYILITNYFFFFSYTHFKGMPQKRDVISGWFLLIAVFMSPYWIFLSDDWGRLYQTLAMSICSLWLIMPYERLAVSLPGLFLKVAIWINQRLYKVIVPTRGLLLMILLFLGISPYKFQFVAAFLESPFGSVFKAVLDAGHLLRLAF